ncbi:MAG: ARPP-1 family domain-containing protein [Isosphaerales bacterium]
MTRPLSELWQTVQVMEPQQDSGLQVFGLRWQSESTLSYSTLDEALAAGTLEVTEVTEGGSVPTLKVVNRADAMAFLMAGEQLIGSKQNRVLNVSIMAPAQTTLSVPVSCVEAGRWNYRSAKFASGGTSSHGLLRKMLSKQTGKNYRDSGQPSSDQGAVWGEVARKLGAMGSASPSQAFDQVYKDHQTRLGELVGRMSPPDGCHGVIFAVGGQIAGADLFDRPATLSKLWSKLVRAYALDALETGLTETTTAEVVSRWVHSAAVARAEPFPSPGLGRDFRLEAPGLFGSALVVDDQAVHVELFAEPASPGK